MDVGVLLRNHCLGHYEAAFRDNEIDAEVLPDLTDADLEKLGVLMGHRKQRLRRSPVSAESIGIAPRVIQARRSSRNLTTPPNAVS